MTEGFPKRGLSKFFWSRKKPLLSASYVALSRNFWICFARATPTPFPSTPHPTNELRPRWQRRAFIFLSPHHDGDATDKPLADYKLNDTPLSEP